MARIEAFTLFSDRGVPTTAALATASESPRQTPRTAGFDFRCATNPSSVA
jgi:hypothetical protein